MTDSFEHRKVSLKIFNENTSLKEGSITIIPKNFETENNPDEYIFWSTSQSLQKIFKKSELPISEPIFNQDSFFLEQRSVNWFGPAILITGSTLSENSHLVSITLSVLANFLTDLFKGRPTVRDEKPEAEFSIISHIEGGCYTEFKYKGSVEGISKATVAMEIINKTQQYIAQPVQAIISEERNNEKITEEETEQETPVEPEAESETNSGNSTNL